MEAWTTNTSFYTSF
jgi:hypothetical protein